MHDNSSMSNDNFNLESSQCRYGYEWISKLRSAKYLVPCKTISAKAGDELEMAVLISPSGEKFLPAFTDLQELEKWPFEKHQIVLRFFDNLKYVVLNDPYSLSGMIINPFGDRIVLKSAQIRQIDVNVESVSPQNARSGPDMRFLRPRRKFPELGVLLKAYFKRYEEVYSVYLMMATELGKTSPHWLFLIDFDGEKLSLFPELINVIHAFMHDGESFEILKATYTLLQLAAELGEPIYRK
ncbi:SseB protein N-terminal domain-containing protein [Sporobacter termitidis DSM 10068]|uniref:SseB protein N-terminal domain-containing protein n=1 Tax=Sporobacter termitidis DSM 10068 TaxID=1123282 RepID=A0A1M5WMD6_9FIRM|nr:enhanced serine sensitivity protein SseB C-terminal domain-containing protein [Sporobacter termitidis]SHH88686.1 SseB protein N-terminal domain-containing protein [Sporobacter termitidis DSM 10068]